MPEKLRLRLYSRFCRTKTILSPLQLHIRLRALVLGSEGRRSRHSKLREFQPTVGEKESSIFHLPSSGMCSLPALLYEIFRFRREAFVAKLSTYSDISPEPPSRTANSPRCCRDRKNVV